MEKIKIYTSKKKSILLFIGALAFVVGGIYMFMNAESFRGSPILTQIIGIITVVFFGFGIYVSIRQLIQNQLMLIIDNKGINVNPKKSLGEVIEWKFIEGFKEIEIRSTKIIIIKVTNPKYWIEKETNKIRKKMMEFNAKHYNSPFNFSANTMQINHKDLMNLLNENLNKYKYVG